MISLPIYPSISAEQQQHVADTLRKAVSLPMSTGPTVFVHEKALCETEDIGAGTRVWAFAHVMKGVSIGEDCNIGDHVFIETGARLGDRVTVKNNVLLWDRVTIEDEVFLGPNAVFTNDLNPRVAFKKPPERFLPTLVRRGASIGANATIVCGVTIGEQAFVGAGAVVTATCRPMRWWWAIPLAGSAGCAPVASACPTILAAGADAAIGGSARSKAWRWCSIPASIPRTRWACGDA